MNREGLTRRDLLRIAGIGAGSMVLGCGDNEVPREADNGHAAFVVEPEVDSFTVVVWSSVPRGALVLVRSGDEIAFAAMIDVAGATSVEVSGLSAGVAYEVTIGFDDDVRLGPYRVCTAPSADDPRPVRLAVSADIDPNPEFDSDLLLHLAAAKPELFVSLGDFPYADNGPALAMTVDEYRERYAEALTAPKLRSWLQTTAVRAIYDDHEFRNDWDAVAASAEPDRCAAALQAWDEFFPVRGAPGNVRYRSWRWGAYVECFLLDCRRYRSANAAPDDAAKVMLGETQRAWLLDGVRGSPAPFKLVFTSVPLDFGDGGDHWAAFSHERQLVFDGLLGVPGVLFVSADQHWFSSHRHAYGIREFQVGPLCRGIGTPHASGAGVLFRKVDYNAGLIDIADGRLTFWGLGSDDSLFYKETFRPEDLTPTR